MRTLLTVLSLALLVGCSSTSSSGDNDVGSRSPSGGRPGNTVPPGTGGSGTDTGIVDEMDAADLGPVVTDVVDSDTEAVEDPITPDPGPREDWDPSWECASITATAELVAPPVDIVWAIDTSGSMSEELVLVKNQIVEFVNYIERSGLNVRVVMIAADNLCVPAPLSGGGCPDADTERYRHVRHSVGSTDAFKKIYDLYPLYEDFLRPEAALHFIVISDDESKTSAANFAADMRGRGLTDWTFHAIVSLTEECTLGFNCKGCSGPYGKSKKKGTRYITAATDTGGTASSICATDWSPTFHSIGDVVVSSAELPCDFRIPDFPAGTEFVLDSVEVGLNGSSLPRVDNEAACRGGAGWHFDHPTAPTLIELCPASCGADLDDDEVEIIFGCVKG